MMKLTGSQAFPVHDAKGGITVPKGSPELAKARREEIFNACEKLYQTMSFKEITLRNLAGVTSFTHTSIYN